MPSFFLLVSVLYHIFTNIPDGTIFGGKTKSAINGQAEAQFVLGLLFFDIKNDFTEAKFWLDKAVEQEYELAARYLIEIENFLKKFKIDTARIETEKKRKEQIRSQKQLSYIKKVNSISYGDVMSIMYEKKISNKVHFWRGR